MQNLSLSDDFVKSISKDELIQHFADNQYNWPETDIVAYWTRLNPTPKAEAEATPPAEEPKKKK